MAGLQYPLLGLLYFLAHPKMWCQVLCAALGLLVLFIVLLVLLGVYAFSPQMEFLNNHIHMGAVSALLAVLFVVLEAVVLLLITAGVFIAGIQDKLFENTLLEKGVHIPGFANIGIRRGLATTLWHLVLNVGVFLIALPLNMVPVVGSLLFCLLLAVPRSWELQALYFDANALSIGDQTRFIRGHVVDYVSFGFVVQMLDLVPLLNVITMFTNCVGAALWIAELEQTGRGVNSTQQSVVSAAPYFPVVEVAPEFPPNHGKPAMEVEMHPPKQYNFS